MRNDPLTMATSERIGNYAFRAKLRKGQRDFAGEELAGIVVADKTLRKLDFQSARVRELRVIRGGLEACDFSGAQIDGFAAEGTTFTATTFHRTIVHRLSLRNVDLRDCATTSVSCDTAFLDSVTFTASNLSQASFQAARFERAAWLECNLDRIDVRGAVFIDCDVRPVCDAPMQSVYGATFDWKTVCKSLQSVRLMRMLLASGMPEIMATYALEAARTVDPLTLFRLMRSTFISYGGPDARFARALRDRLHENGVRTFFFEDDAMPGERLHRVMRRGVNEHDRVILVCSKASLNRPGVRNELEETLAREARDGGASYLIPVILDDYLFEWTDVLRHALLDRVVADFRGAIEDDDKFDVGIVRLLSALRIS